MPAGGGNGASNTKFEGIRSCLGLMLHVSDRDLECNMAQSVGLKYKAVRVLVSLGMPATFRVGPFPAVCPGEARLRLPHSLSSGHMLGPIQEH